MKRRRLKPHKRHNRNEHKAEYPLHKLIICSDNYMNEEHKSRTPADDSKYFVIEHTRALWHRMHCQDDVQTGTVKRNKS